MYIFWLFLRFKVNLVIDYLFFNFGFVGLERCFGFICYGEVNDEDLERNLVVSEGRSVMGMMIISFGRV